MKLALKSFFSIATSEVLTCLDLQLLFVHTLLWKANFAVMLGLEERVERSKMLRFIIICFSFTSLKPTN